LKAIAYRTANAAKGFLELIIDPEAQKAYEEVHFPIDNQV